MLHRTSTEGTLLITQPAHALVSGHLARAWGNELTGDFSPREEVCLAAALHDIGWLGWEASPTFNAVTGLPHNFRELATDDHLRNWEHAASTAAILNRYVGLLVSLHGTGLYARFGTPAQDAEEQRQVDAFLRAQEAQQRELIDGLQHDARYQLHVQPEALARNRRLIAVWDWMSLMICMNLQQPAAIEQVPAHGGDISLHLRPVAGRADHITVDPWPFQVEPVTVAFDAKLLPRALESQAELDAALASAPWRCIEVHLQPAR